MYTMAYATTREEKTKGMSNAQAKVMGPLDRHKGAEVKKPWNLVFVRLFLCKCPC